MQISENNNDLKRKSNNEIEGIINYLDIVKDKYENISWYFLIKENEYIIYYNLNNHNDRDIFYYDDKIELYFKNEITVEQIIEIKNLKSSVSKQNY